ncbi:glycosyltransferase family 2 protein [Ignavibacterium sp.]|uniref:glycosyltransferase family 2 protein n=1 Tax=Ignavibacterium sp. TaxID=2651167 RepID=UPI00220261B3|nr:glycosyltransferase family 2 protein [Ignavibacterium sp.]BDQ02783.1 MAG: hypothetical protein KatS3mg037_1358 [Ignavibacterium sp.]
MLPIVSICIPVYNSSEWLSQTILSAINQSYKNIEIIIVDDGSTDNSWNIIEEYQKKFPEIIKAIRQENKGACSARNKALSVSNGHYIQWLDSDDLLDKYKIESQLEVVKFVKDTEILLSCSFAKFYEDISKTRFIPNSLWQDLSPENWLQLHLKDNSVIYPHCWLVNRRITEKAGTWNENILLNQDGEYFSRVVASSKFVKFVPEAKCYYRTGNLSSISNNKSKRKIVSLINANLEIVNNALNFNNNESMKTACRIFLQNFYSKLLFEDDEIPEIHSLKKKILSLDGNIPQKMESFRFFIMRKILGLKLARTLKLFFWSMEIRINKLLNKI